MTKGISFASSLLQHLPDPLRRPLSSLYTAIMLRTQDVLPEYMESKPSTTTTNPWGWLPFLILGDACALLIIAYSYKVSQNAEKGFEAFFLTGLCLVFLPTIVRLVLPKTSRWERIGLLCALCVSCYLVKVMAGPLYFTFFDEFLHWRTASDIFQTDHLFSSNTLLPVSPYYPGLEIITDALSTLGGLTTFQAGLIVIGIAHFLMILTFFLLNEQILLSSRAASLATILYIGNPHFILFDAQYSYESLALPLTIFLLFLIMPHQSLSERLKYLLTRPQTRLKRLHLQPSFIWFMGSDKKEVGSNLRWIVVTATLTFSAIAITHHATTFFLLGILFCWTLIYALMRQTLRQSHLLKITLLAGLIVIGISLYPGNPVLQYFLAFFAQVANEMMHIVAAGGSARQLFVSYTGQPTPWWDRFLSVLSVLTVLCCLPFGLLCLWQRYRSNALTVLFGLIALMYPLSQLFRFTDSGAELTDRIAAFLFLPISITISIFLVQFWPTRKINIWSITFISIMILVVCIGGIILGTGPTFDQLPGSYAVSADSLSIEPEGIQAAVWTSSYLGKGNRVATDRINQILMGTYGNQTIVTSIQDAIDVSPVFLSPKLDATALGILRSTHTRYLVVDLRLSQHLPLVGYYYEATEEGAFHHTTPVSIQALTKFATIPQINKVFDSGDIVIYDIGGLTNVPEKP